MSKKYKLGKYRISIANDKRHQNKPVTITDEKGNDVLNGGGGGGSDDYNELNHKPSINGVTLQGDKTTEQLGLTPNNLDTTNFEKTALAKSTDAVRTYADSEDTKIPTEKFLQKTLHNIELPEADKDAANKKYVDDLISELSGKVLKFKGFISPMAPTGTIKDGSLWYEGNALPTTFPINVKTYNATTSQWSTTTSEYSPESLDLWANLNDDKGYYWFGNGWNMIDDNGRFLYVSSFNRVIGNPSILYYLDTTYDSYEKGFYRFIPASGGNPEKFVLLNKELFKYVSTFTGETGDVDRLYFLDTNYDEYTIGFYRYVEVDESGVTVGKFIHIGNPKQLQVTYSELKEMRDNSMLIPGMQYRITDYHTTVLPFVTNARSADHQFDVIVCADDASHLNENAFAAHHEGDEYFANCKLEAWELQYRLENEKWSRVAGTFIEDDSDGYHMRKLGTVEIEGTTYILWDASEYTEYYEITRAVSEDEEIGTELLGYDPETGEILDDGWTSTIASKSVVEADGQGTILMLKDEYGNQCPFDFKSIQFKRWAVTDSQQSRDGLNGKYMGILNNVPQDLTIEDEEDFIWAYTFSSDAAGSEDQVDYSLDGTHYVYGNVLEMAPDAINDLNDVVFYGEHNYDNHLGVNCFNNTFGNSCCSNSFGNRCYSHSFGNSCCSNSFGNSCCSNSFGNSCQNNSFGNSCYSNSFGNNCGGNSFGNNCGGNSFGNNCGGNSFGNYCQNNSFGNCCKIITVFDGVQNCSVTGGSQSAPVKNAQILNGTAGASALNKLTIAFTANKAYTQAAAKTMADKLRIWNIADVGDIQGEESIIDVAVLPTTGIKAKTLYRMHVHRYLEDGEPLSATPTGYVARGALAVVDENGITDTGVSPAVLYPWDEIDDDRMDWLIRKNLMREVPATDLMTVSTCFRTAANHHVYMTHVTEEDVYELYHNPTATAGEFVKVGGDAASAETDNVTTQKVNGKLQANAIIEVQTLPATGYKQNSLYRMLDTATQTSKRFYYNDSADPLPATPEFYKGDGEHVTFGADSVTVNGSATSYAMVSEVQMLMWINNGWVEVVTDFAQAGAFKMPISLVAYDSTTKLTEEDYIVTAEMDKVFKRVQGGWECISYIQLDKEQYDILSNAQKNDGTLYIVND